MIIYFTKNISITIFSILALFLSLIVTTDGVTDTLRFQPWLTVEQEYTDNILFVENNPQYDYITTVSPAFSVKKKTSRFDGDITAALDTSFYQESDELNAVDNRSSGSLSYLFTERLKLGISGGYIQDSRSDREVGETGLIFSGDREQMRGNFSGQYQLSEVTVLEASAGYLAEDIDSSNNETLFLNSEQNNTFTVGFSLSHNISKLIRNTNALFDIKYMNYLSESPDVRAIAYSDLPEEILLVIADPEDGSYPELIRNSSSESNYDVFNISAGFSKEMTERLSFFIKSGASCVMSDETATLSITSSDTTLYDAASSFDGGTTWGWLLFSGVSYRGVYDRIDVNISRDVKTASGLNGTTERSGVLVKYTRNLTEKLSGQISGNFYLNQSDRVSRSDIDELTINGSAGLTYNFSRLWRGSLDWNYTNVEERERDFDRDRNRVYGRIVRIFDFDLITP
ncbi:MAG: hypothetical protein HQK70_11590 [Desulfamplus sp.]|nr:hypothetical protein [Desulfamplus sp.]